MLIYGKGGLDLVATLQSAFKNHCVALTIPWVTALLCEAPLIVVKTAQGKAIYKVLSQIHRYASRRCLALRLIGLTGVLVGVLRAIFLFSAWWRLPFSTLIPLSHRCSLTAAFWLV